MRPRCGFKHGMVAPRVYLVHVYFLMVSMRLRVCRASASPLPEVHHCCLMYYLVNYVWSAALVDTRWVRWIAVGIGR